MIDGIDSDGLPKLAVPLAYGYFIEYMDGSYEIATDGLDLQLLVDRTEYMGRQYHPARKVAIYAVD